MARREQSLVFLDTHIVMWLYDALLNRFMEEAKELLNQAELRVSPLVILELGYLQEIKRIKPFPSQVLLALSQSLGLKQSEPDMRHVITEALAMHWTRDPFDRLITAESAVNDAWLMSADKTIQEHYCRTIC